MVGDMGAVKATVDRALVGEWRLVPRSWALAGKIPLKIAN
jgi:hypothetical protein